MREALLWSHTPHEVCGLRNPNACMQCASARTDTLLDGLGGHTDHSWILGHTRRPE